MSVLWWLAAVFFVVAAIGHWSEGRGWESVECSALAFACLAMSKERPPLGECGVKSDG